MKLKPPLIMVHGGAGSSIALSYNNRRKRYIEGLKEAVTIGFKRLKSGSVVDAVEEAVKYMEDNPAFNAGYGSALTLEGKVEMDAGIMDGKTLRAGAVACVKRIKNPIVLARKVMELTDHVILAGEEAERFGINLGLELSENMIPKGHYERYKKALEAWRLGEGYHYLKKLRELIIKYPQYSPFGTVGAVALDEEGNVAAATSTGGIWLKMSGRIGDTPIPGAGYYADNRGGAASATGIGECILISGVSRKAVELMIQGVHADTAAKAAINILTEIFGENTAGVITVDIKGRVGVAYNTEIMGRAYLSSDLEEPRVYI